MKAILEFELPEEENEFKLASQADEWYGLVWNLDQWLRGRLKYSTVPEVEKKVYEQMRNVIREDMVEAGMRFAP